MKFQSISAALLLALGLLQMAADLGGIDGLKGLAAATSASPAPKVFSAVRGWETYSSRFYLEWVNGEGEQVSLELTPEIYQRLEGPYVRRNVYGAALAYGPILSTDARTVAMYQAVMRFALALWIDERVPAAFPWGTLAVNVSGCFLIGLLATVADEHRILPPAARLFLVAGVLGGFTTFSTFGLEAWRLVEDSLSGAALIYVSASLVGTLVAVVLGVLIGRALA